MEAARGRGLLHYFSKNRKPSQRSRRCGSGAVWFPQRWILAIVLLTALTARAYGFFPHQIRTVSSSNLIVLPGIVPPINTRIGGNPASANDLIMPVVCAGGRDESFMTTTIPTSPRFKTCQGPFLSYIYRAGNPASFRGVRISCAHRFAVSVRSSPLELVSASVQCSDLRSVHLF